MVRLPLPTRGKCSSCAEGLGFQLGETTARLRKVRCEILAMHNCVIDNIML